MSSRWRWLLAVLLVPASFGCAQDRTTSTATVDSTSTTRTVSATERGEYEGNAERRLAELGARIDSLQIRMQAAGSRAKAEMRDELDSLRVQRERARVQLAQLRSSADAHWRDAKREMAGLLDALDRQIDRARAGLREGSS